MLACQRGNMTMVRALLRHGASTDAVDVFGNTVLDHAVWYKHTAIIRLLSRRSTNP